MKVGLPLGKILATPLGCSRCHQTVVEANVTFVGVTFGRDIGAAVFHMNQPRYCRWLQLQVRPRCMELGQTSAPFHRLPLVQGWIQDFAQGRAPNDGLVLECY